MTGPIGEVLLLREHLINGELKHIVKHARNDNFEQFAILIEAGVRVHFQKPAIAVSIQHVVKAKQLKLTFLPLRVQFLGD